MIKTLSDVHRWIFSERLLISAGELEIGKLVQIRLCPRQSSAVSPSYGSRKSLETFANIVIIFWAGGKKSLRLAKLQKHNQSFDLMSALLGNQTQNMKYWIQITNTNTRHKYKTSKPRSCVSCFEWSDPHCSAGTLVAYQFKSLCSSTKLFVSSTNWSISMSLSPKVACFSCCPHKT